MIIVYEQSHPDFATRVVAKVSTILEAQDLIAKIFLGGRGYVYTYKIG